MGNSSRYVKVHWTHKLKIRNLFKQGFTDTELAIMYKTHWSVIQRITYNVKQQERI